MSKNYLKFTLLKCKYLEGNPPSPYKIKIAFNEQCFESEKISGKEIEYGGGKCFYFPLPQVITEEQSIVISAVNSTWMVFNNTIASLVINYNSNVNNFNDQKKWYNLTLKGANVISVLASIWCEFSNDSSLTGLNISVLNNTYSSPINLSGIPLPMVSPLNNTINHIGKHSSSFNPNITYEVGEIEKMLEKCGEKDEEYEKLKTQVNTLKEKENFIKTLQQKNNQNLEKIKEKEINLNKDKTNLEDKIKKFKQSQIELEKKNYSLTQNSLKLENESAKFLIQREIESNTNQLFYNLNFFIHTQQDIEMNPSPNIKLDIKQEIKDSPSPKNVPIAQINLSNYDFQTPKNEKFENKLIDSLECNLASNENKKGKNAKRNDSSKVKKNNHIGQTIQTFKNKNKLTKNVSYKKKL